MRLDGRAASSGATAGLFWGAVGVLAFSVSLPATRMAIAGGLDASFVGIGRAVVAGLLAVATLALMRQPLPPARLLPRLAVVAACIVLGLPAAELLAAVVLCGLDYAEGGALARELGGVQVICLALALCPCR